LGVSVLTESRKQGQVEQGALSVTRLFDLALDLLCVAGTDGYFKRINDAFERVLGFTKEELTAKPFVDFVHPEDVDATLAAVADLESGRVVNDFENRFRTKSGEWRWLVWRSMPSEDGRLIYACARDVTDEKHTLAVADERGEIVARQSKDLERVGRVHRIMTQAVADGATTVDVLRAVAELTGKPTALFSAAFKVLHTVDPGTSTGPPTEWTIESAGARVRRLLAAVDSSHPSTVLPAMPAVGVNVRHLIGRIVTRGEDIGYLLVAEVGQGLSAFDAQVVEHSSTVIGLEIVSSRRHQEAESQAREDFLADLLQGDRDPERLRRRSASYGVDLAAPHVLVRVAWDPGAQHRITGSARRAYFARRLGEHLGDSHVIAVGVPGADVFLCPLPDVGRREAMEAVRGAVRSALESVAGAGLGRPVALAGDMGVLRAFMSTGTAEPARRFAEELLAPLIEHDKTGAELMTTLRVFLACNAQYRKTASELGVHENTVRYRMHQIKQLAAIDPDDLDSLLDVRFALQISDITSDPVAGVVDEVPPTAD
jgi:PAS domain S-box-containing protein